MYEFHGWVTIREGWNESQDDEVLLARNVEEIRTEAKRLAVEGFGCKAEVGVANGLYRLTIHGFRNHPQPWVRDLFEAAGRIAKGAYGLLYVHDDEDPDFNNEFQVWVMIRGKVERQRDQHLSPYMPMLEE